MDSIKRQKWTDRFGFDQVQAFEATLSKRLKYCADSWGLTDITVAAGAQWSFVGYCQQRGKDRVLRLAAQEGEIDSQALKYRAWHDSHYTPALVAYQPGIALLTERVMPGVEFEALGRELAVGEMCEMLTQIHVDASATSLRHVVDRKESHLSSALVTLGEEHQSVARWAVKEFEKWRDSLSCDRPVIIHGDIHDRNLLVSSHAFALIDPGNGCGPGYLDAALYASRRSSPDLALDLITQVAGALRFDTRTAIAWTGLFAFIEAAAKSDLARDAKLSIVQRCKEAIN